jgi:23S rRNA (adenine2503-C2)-methyltransferase
MDRNLLRETLERLGEPNYRERQIWAWLARGASAYAEMTDLPGALRDEFEAHVPLSTLTLAREARASDGTVKALLRTARGQAVETVLMRYRDGRRSLCLSSQSGCPLTCSFCATGRMRFAGNLSADEILDQALHFRRSGEVDHAVFMGMGEPMMNLDAVLEACTLLPTLGITNRRTAISTVGWIPGIERLTASGLSIRLALSLHAPHDDLRSTLMAVNERYPLADVLDACRADHAIRRRTVFIEYVMLAGVNDRHAHALELAHLLSPREAFKVNLIPYNPTDSRFEASGRDAIGAFRATLESRGVPVTVRLTRGREIAAACGQLAAAPA